MHRVYKILMMGPASQLRGAVSSSPFVFNVCHIRHSFIIYTLWLAFHFPIFYFFAINSVYVCDCMLVLSLWTAKKKYERNEGFYCVPLFYSNNIKYDCRTHHNNILKGLINQYDHYECAHFFCTLHFAFEEQKRIVNSVYRLFNCIGRSMQYCDR